MQQEGKNPRRGAAEPDFPLQWGSRKRLRCVKARDDGSPANSDGVRRTTPRIKRRIFGESMASPSPRRPAPLSHRNSESANSENQKSRSLSPSPEKDRFYSTRGSALGCDEHGTAFVGSDDKGTATTLPRFFISLSNKEKEEDFMAMKGCKLPQRPKKRSKLIQKCLLLVSPGAWLSDLSQERYEVREKKSSRKRIRGLKAMCMESDSE